MSTVDSLEIQLSAQATKANTALDSLINKLGALNTSLSSINGSGLTGLANGVNRLATSMQGMNNIKTTDFTRLVKNVKKFGEINTSDMNKAASAMNLMTKSFNKMGVVSSNAEKIGQLAKSISQLGYKSALNAVDNIPKLASAMKELMNTLSKAPQVNQNLINMTNALAKLARTGASSGKAATSVASSLNAYSTASSKAGSATKSFNLSFGGLVARITSVVFALKGLGGAIELSSDLTEAQNVIDSTFGNYSSKIEDLAKTSIIQLGMSELSVKQIAGRFQAMGTAIGFSQGKMSDMSVELTKLAGDMASFYNVEQNDVARSLQAVFTGESEPLRKYGLDLTQTTLQEWAMKQGIDANISSMSQAEKTMLRYQYVMENTSIVQGDFARTANTWANQVRVLQEQIKKFASVIGTGFIAAFKPFLQTLNIVMAKVIDFAENVLNALGHIFGWKFEISAGGIADDLPDDLSDAATDLGDASGKADDLSDGLSKATKNAKKLKTVTLGIDELNINAPDDNNEPSGSGTGGTGGSGGKGSGTGAGAGTGLTTSMTRSDSLLKAYESSIDSLYELGEYIGKTLTNAMNSINWDSVYQSARNFGKGLAEFLNGLISPELFGAVGRTIAGALNTAIYATLSFGQTFDWKDFGLSIATGINEFFRTFDFSSLAEDINVWVQGIWTTLSTALANIDWLSVYDGIVKFLENLDIKTIGIIIGAITIKEILSLNLGEAALTFIGTTISEKIATAIATALGLELGTNAGIGTALMAAGKSIGITFVAGFKALLGSEAAASALAFINPVIVTITGVASVAAGAFLSVFNFVSMLKDGFSWIKEAIMLVGIAITAVGAVILGVSATVAAPVALIVAGFATAAILIKDNWNSISKFFKDLWEGIKSTFSSVKEFFKQKFDSAYKAITDAFKGITNWFKAKWDTIVSIFTPVAGFFKSKFESAYNFVKNAFSSINGWFKGKWDAVVGIFNAVPGFFKKTFEAGYSAVKKAFRGISSFFKGIANDIVKPIESAVNGVIKGLNWILDKVGSKKKIELWSAPKFAKGTNGLPQDTVGVVNDQPGSTYREMIVPPKGKPFIPEGRNIMLPMEKGTKIMPANQTKQYLDGMPHFAGGIGKFVSGIWESVKSFTGNVMDYITNPEKIVQIAFDKFIDTSRWGGAIGDIAGGAVKTVYKSAVNFIKKLFGNSSMEKALNWAVGIANDNRHGYDQAHRTGPDYDCSSLVTIALGKAGLNVGLGTTSTMYGQLKAVGFKNVSGVNKGNANGMKRGDVLLTPGKHTAMYLGGNKIVHARINEFGGVTGGKTGDQTGNEIAVTPYHNHPWTYVLRYAKAFKNGIGRIGISDLIPAYSVGGFPEDGLFMANHSELVGKFNNGRTAVANNEQITDGIEEASYRGFVRAISENKTQESLMRELISAVKEGKSIKIDGRELVSAYDNRKQRNGFSFT